MGARLAEKYDQKGNEVITLNKPVVAKMIGDKVSDKQFDIRSSRDVVSVLAPTQTNKNMTTIKANTANPLLEHKTNILNRQPDKVFGKVESTQPVVEGSGFTAVCR